MVAPARFTSGSTQDQVWQMMGQVGVPNPAWYHQTFDDFDFYDTNEWTTVTGSTGTVATAAGDGGLIVLTTAATSSDFEGIHRPVAGFTFSPPNGSTVAGKKNVFFARITLSNILSGFVVGLANLSATPFALTDGVYVTKAINVAAINLVSIVGGVATTIPFPAASYSFLANAVTFDTGWFYNPSNGQGGTTMLGGFMGQNLVGYSPQSGSGAGNLSGNPPRQPVVSFNQVNGSVPTLTTANLTPTAAVQAPSAAAVTMTVDFIYNAKER